MKTLGYIVIGIVAIAVIAGFFIAGSPQEERLRRFDDLRVSHLSTIQSQVINYWQQKGTLPPNLDALEDDISGFRNPQDPETGAIYEYSATGPDSFRFCANFSRPSSVDTFSPRSPYYGDMFGGNWEHGEGKVCFDRKIDKELYPPITDQKPR